MNILKTQLCNFHNISMDDALSQIKLMSKSEQLDIVITPNIDHLVRLTDVNVDDELIDIYHQASLSLCDSKILEKVLLAKGKSIVEVIPGSTLTYNLFNSVIATDDKVAVIGGDDSVIAKLRKLYPEMTIYHFNPPMGFINKPDQVQQTIDFITDSDANYTFLAIGSPRQEILAHKLNNIAGSKGVVLCIGASILFLVGEERRAPLWIQKLHCEWFYRMCHDPKRLIMRYGYNFIKLPKLYRSL